MRKKPFIKRRKGKDYETVRRGLPKVRLARLGRFVDPEAEREWRAALRGDLGDE